MSLSRPTGRFSRTVLAQCRNSPLLSGRHDRTYISSFTNHFYNKASLLHHSALNSSDFQWLEFSSSASPQQPNEKVTSQSGNEHGKKCNNEADSSVNAPDQTKSSMSEEKTEPLSNTRRVFTDSDSDLDSELSRDDLVKLVAEKEQLLRSKQEELMIMKDIVQRNSTEMKNVTARARNESEYAQMLFMAAINQSNFNLNYYSD